MGVHGRARDRGDPRRPRRGGRARVRIDDPRRPRRPAAAARTSSFGGRGPDAVRHAVRPHADREVRDGRPAGTCTSSAPRSSSSPRSRCRPATTPSHNPEAYYRDPITIDDVQTLADDRRPAHEAALLHPQRRRRRGRAHHRGAGPGPRARSRCGCSAPARRPRHTTMSEWEDFTESPAARERAARVRAGRRDARRHRHLPDLRRVHVDGAADASKALGFCKKGEGGPFVADGRHAPRRRAPDQHRRRRPLALPPRHARHVPARRGGPPAPRRGARPPGRERQARAA